MASTVDGIYFNLAKVIFFFKKEYYILIYFRLFEFS